MSRFKPETLIDDTVRNQLDSISRMSTPKSDKAWNNVISKMGIADEKLKAFLLTKDEAFQTKDLATFKQYLQQNNKAIDLATLKMQALALAKNLAFNIGIGLLMSGVSKGIQWLDDNVIHKMDRLKESLETSKQEFANTQSEIESVNGELKTTSERLSELENKGNLTFTEKEEYDNLVKQNNELERQKIILEELLKAKNKTKQSDFLSIMDEGFSGNTAPKEDSLVFGDSKAVGDSLTIEKYLSAKEDGNEKAISKYSKKMVARVEEYQKIADGINYIPEPTTKDEEKVNKYLDYINDFQDKVAIALGNNGAKTAAFNRVVDNWQFDSVAQGLQDLGKEGKVTANMLNDPKYDEFIQKLTDLGVIENENDLDDVALAFNNIGTAAESAAEDVKKTSASLSGLKTASDNIGTLSAAFKEISDDGYITTKTIDEIKTATGLSSDEWETYESKLLRAKTGSAEFNQVMSDLTYKMVDNMLSTVDLTNATDGEISAIENKIAAVLRENNISNANEVATYAVSRAKETLRIKTALTTATTADAVIALATEATQAGITGQAFNNLVLDIGIFNNKSLSVEDKIAALQQLGYAADAARIKINSVTGTVTAGRDYYVNGTNIGGQIVKSIGRKTYNGEEYIVYYDARGNAISREKISSTSSTVTAAPTVPKYTNPSSSSKSSGQQTQSKVFDWIETLFDRTQKVTENFSKVVSRTFKGLNTRLTATLEVIGRKTSEIEAQQKAYDRYMQEADKVGLNETWAAKVRNGDFDISTVTDEALAEKISQYQEWYEKALECNDAIGELSDTLSDLYQTRFKNTEAAYDDVLNSITHRANSLDALINRAEEKGLIGSTRYYTVLRGVESEKLQRFQYKHTDLTNKLNEAVDSGTIEKYSEAWYEMQQSIDSAAESIAECENNLIEYDNTMRQIQWDRFDYLQDSFSDFKDESDFLSEILGSGDELFEKNGQFKDVGLASVGLHGLNYNILMTQAESYAKELERINEQLSDNVGDTNLLKRRQELLEAQRDSIKAAKDEKEAMIDLVKNGINLELSSLKELIDKYNDSLDSAKSLYEYQQDISEQTKNISDIEKQLSAYANDTSEESRATIQKLKKSLADAQKELKDTEYDKYVSDQKELLDDLYDKYEELLNNRLDNSDKLFEELIDKVNNSSDDINKTLQRESASVGIKLSKEMSSVWGSQKTALEKYFDNNGVVLSGLSGYFENSNTSLSGINTAVGSIVESMNTLITYAATQAGVDLDPVGSKEQMINNSRDWWSANDSERNSLSVKNDAYGKAFGYTKKDGAWYDASGNVVYTVSDDEKVRNIINKMKSNSAAWNGASDSEKARLANENKTLANRIQSIVGENVSIDSNGVWWIGNKELYAYKSGGLVTQTGAAWLDGTKSNPELVLNSEDTKNFLELKNVLRNLPKGIYLKEQFCPDVEANYHVGQLADTSGLFDKIREIPTYNVENNVGDINISIPIEHVEDYNDFVSQLQKDKKFEKFVRSVSVDLLNGGSVLAKNKFKW